MTTADVGSPLERARHLGQSGDYRAVVSLMNEFVQREPDNVDALFLLGAACFKLNLFVRAREAWTRILKIDPHHQKSENWLKKLPREEIAYFLSRARSLGQAEDYKGVTRTCNELLSRYPDTVEALFLQGAALFKLEMFGRARESWERVLQISPTHDKARRWLAKLPPEEQTRPGARPAAPQTRSTPTRNADGRIEIRHKESFEVLRAVKGDTLENCDLAGTDLRGAELFKANLARANLYAADLSDSHMTDANLTDANLRSTVLTDAQMSGAILRHANLVSAFLRGANLSDANLAESDLTRAILNSASLEGSNLHEATLVDADLGCAVLIEANLSAANMEGVSLASAFLRSANLAGANLAGADLTRVNLSNANLEGVNLEGASLRGAFLRAANLSNANLAGADLTRANLSSANLEGANLGDSNLTDADLGAALLIDANLAGADVAGTNLAGADLTRTNLEGTNLVLADLNGTTVRNRDGSPQADPAALADSPIQTIRERRARTALKPAVKSADSDEPTKAKADAGAATPPSAAIRESRSDESRAEGSSQFDLVVDAPASAPASGGTGTSGSAIRLGPPPEEDLAPEAASSEESDLPVLDLAPEPEPASDPAPVAESPAEEAKSSPPMSDLESFLAQLGDAPPVDHEAETILKPGAPLGFGEDALPALDLGDLGAPPPGSPAPDLPNLLHLDPEAEKTLD